MVHSDNRTNTHNETSHTTAAPMCFPFAGYLHLSRPGSCEWSVSMSCGWTSG